MMQHAGDNNLWGKGIYFAEKAAYSNIDKYVFQVSCAALAHSARLGPALCLTITIRLADNPYQRPDCGPRSGPTLCDLWCAAAPRAGLRAARKGKLHNNAHCRHIAQ